MSTRIPANAVKNEQRKRLPTPRPAASGPDLVAYREAVESLLIELAGHSGQGFDPGDTAKAETVLIERLVEPNFTAVLSVTPRGLTGTVEWLLKEVRNYKPSTRSSAADLAAQVRIFLLAQVEAMWWGQTTPFATTADVTTSPDLIDIEKLRRAGLLPFRYRRQPKTFATRAMRAVARRVAPDRWPRTAGMRFTYSRPETIALLGQVAADFQRQAPHGTPTLWVTSMTRSVRHQQHLRDLGYAAMSPSAHCVGWAVDVEMAWFERFSARTALEKVLLDRQTAGDVNVIDEGQAWHVCVSPVAVAELQREFATRYETGRR
ncbi:hypothetical protein SAMN05421812_12210 [Asanoa hainanensis]|uniref:Uncharacterized protein n=1 Tax=Asanoa hainanensis TaxID=560556 RepID=A0A239PEF3_9ACTN|nr:hypothetical protein SAMN05421812_12210 [Asanoa hainanensis]